METKKYIIYTRVSTKRQGESGLSLDAQKDECLRYISSQDGEMIAHYKDVESGKSRERAGLLKAVAKCKAENATLVIAKLDRLARDVEFVFKIINTKINIYFCDMPSVNTLVLGVMASVAQYENELRSDRQKKAFGQIQKRIKEDGAYVAKCSGRVITHLGRMKGCDTSAAGEAAWKINHERKLKDPVWREARAEAIIMRSEGASLQEIADTLNAMGKTTRRGGKWHRASVNRLLNE